MRSLSVLSLILRENEERILTERQSPIDQHRLDIGPTTPTRLKTTDSWNWRYDSSETIVSIMHYVAQKTELTPKFFNVAVDAFIVFHQFLLQSLSFTSRFQEFCHCLLRCPMFIVVLKEARSPFEPL